MATDKAPDVSEILNAVRAAVVEGEAVVARAREDHRLAKSSDDADDGPLTRAWKARDLSPEPPPSPLSTALIEMIKTCIVESERTGRYVTAGLALKRLQEHCEAYDTRELPPDEQSWDAVAAKYVPLPAARIRELIGRVSRNSALLRCTKCDTGMHSRCACGAPYVRHLADAPPVAPESKAGTALGRALAAVAAHPEKSNRALAADTGISHVTIGKARKLFDNRRTEKADAELPVELPHEGQP